MRRPYEAGHSWAVRSPCRAKAGSDRPLLRAQAHTNNGLHKTVASVRRCWRLLAQANATQTIRGESARR